MKRILFILLSLTAFSGISQTEVSTDSTAVLAIEVDGVEYPVNISMSGLKYIQSDIIGEPPGASKATNLVKIDCDDYEAAYAAETLVDGTDYLTNCQNVKTATSASFDFNLYREFHYDDSSIDAGAITFENMQNGDKVKIKYNRAAEPSYVGETPVQDIDTYSYGVWPASEVVVAVYYKELGVVKYVLKKQP